MEVDTFIILGATELESATSASQMPRATNCATPRYFLELTCLKSLLAESGGFEPHWFHPAHRFQDESVTLTVRSPEDAIANMNIYYRQMTFAL